MLFIDLYSKKVYEGNKEDILAVLNPQGRPHWLDVDLKEVKPIKISKQYADTFRLLQEKEAEVRSDLEALRELQNTLYKNLNQN